LRRLARGVEYDEKSWGRNAGIGLDQLLELRRREAILPRAGWCGRLGRDRAGGPREASRKGAQPQQ
jgi:hypothetical protein